MDLANLSMLDTGDDVLRAELLEQQVLGTSYRK
jgi:hypothetical protein